VTTTRAEIGRRKRARTRAGLLDAAMRVFARLGPDAATIDDVITEAGVARGTFYNYFTTLDDVLVAVAIDLSDRLFADTAKLRLLADPADRIACTLRSFIRKAAADPVWGAVIVRIALMAAPLGTSMREGLAQDVDAGLAEGRLRAPSVQAAYDTLLGLGLMGMRSALRNDAADDHAEQVAELVLHALQVPEAAAIARLPMDDQALAARAIRPRRAAPVRGRRAVALRRGVTGPPRRK
jgi:AcrR family transcriptional regulator